MRRLMAVSLLCAAIGILAGCAHSGAIPDFNETYLPRAAAGLPEKRIELPTEVADKTAVTKRNVWGSSVTYLPVALYWLDKDRLLFNVHSGGEADTLLHSAIINSGTGEIRLLDEIETLALAEGMNKRVSLVNTNNAFLEALKIVAGIAVAVLSRSNSSGGGSSVDHYAATVENNGATLSLKLAVSKNKHLFGSHYYNCDYSLKDNATGKTLEDKSEIELDEVDYELKKRNELKEWLRSWRVSPDGGHYLIGRTATLMDAGGESSVALLERFNRGYVALDINPQWDKIALLRIEPDKKARRLNYAIEFYPFQYRNMPDKTAAR